MSESGECGRVYRVLDAGGVRVRIREACPRDRDALIRFYESLREETVYTRFFSIIRYFDPYVDKLFSKSKNAVVVAETEDGRIVGVAEAVADDGDAESGIAVLEEFQGRGIGRALAEAILEAAARKGIRRLYGYIMTGNHRAYRLARKFGARVKEHYGAMILLEIPVPPSGGGGGGSRGGS